MKSTDALAEANYASVDPQFMDEDLVERLELNDAIDQITSDIDTLIAELESVKNNFSTRKFNTFRYALEEIKDEMEGLKTDD